MVSSTLIAVETLLEGSSLSTVISNRNVQIIGTFCLKFVSIKGYKFLIVSGKQYKPGFPYFKFIKEVTVGSTIQESFLFLNGTGLTLLQNGSDKKASWKFVKSLDAQDLTLPFPESFEVVASLEGSLSTTIKACRISLYALTVASLALAFSGLSRAHLLYLGHCLFLT